MFGNVLQLYSNNVCQFCVHVFIYLGHGPSATMAMFSLQTRWMSRVILNNYIKEIRYCMLIVYVYIAAVLRYNV